MPEFDETLLSAYLDGELPPVERARVEQWLAEQPEDAQLLEELRSIKTSLERLPRERLPHDFAEQVLRQAERETLTSGGDAPAASGFSWRRFRRPAVWAALTLAAGLLLMVFDRRGQPPAAHRQVAFAPRNVPGDGPLIGAPPGKAGIDRARPDDEISTGAAATGSLSGPAAMPAQPEAAEAAAEPESSSLEHDSKPQHSTGRPASPSRAVGAFQGSGGGTRKAEQEAVPGAPARKSGGKRASADDGAGGQRATVSDQALLVWCEVSPDAKYNERFQQLLLDNSIAFSEDEPPAAAAPPAAGHSPQNSQRLLEARQAALDADAELVLVEASEPQIEAVLAELDRDEDFFKAVDVQPAAEVPRQQQFGRFNRGGASADASTQRAAELKRQPQQADKTPADRAAADAATKAGKRSTRRGTAYRLRAGDKQALPALHERLDDAKPKAAKPGEERLQVLFVLQPTPEPKSAAAATEKPSQQD